MPRSKEVSDETLVGMLQDANDPVLTTKEISEQVSITRQAVANRLVDLESQGSVERKKPNRDAFYWVD